MRIRDISCESRRIIEDADLLDFIVSDVERHKRYGRLLLTGFEGEGVIAARSFGQRWYTYCLTVDEARETETETSGDDRVIEWAAGVGKVPAVGVFDGAILERVADSPELRERYLRGSDVEPHYRLYGVPAARGKNLDVATIAVYRFALGINRAWPKDVDPDQ